LGTTKVNHQNIEQTALSRLWLVGGALAVGSGIWSMHFIGMLAFSLPIALAYDIPTTVASLFIAAIMTSGFALAISNRPRISIFHLSLGALLLGGGISAMHYVGMAASRFSPGSFPANTTRSSSRSMPNSNTPQRTTR
jgi:NO-binding membrane sensor protein with MHYT domain